MDETPPSSEALSTSEVQAIVESVQTPEATASPIFNPKRKKGNPNATVQPYDFGSPVYLSPEKVRHLRIKHEEFARTLSSGLSTYLRAEFTLQFGKLETVSYQNLLKDLVSPSHLALFRLKPLEGVAFCEIPIPLGEALLDRMMGGPGKASSTDREFTEIERSVLENFLNLVFKEYTNLLERYQKLQAEFMRHESAIRFLKIFEPTDVLLLLEFPVTFGELSSFLRFVLPYRPMEGLIELMMAEIGADTQTKPAHVSLPSNLNAPVYFVPVPVSAHWRGFQLSLRELQNLNVGDTIMLDPKQCQAVEIDLGSIPKFQGKLKPGTPKVTLQIESKLT